MDFYPQNAVVPSGLETSEFRLRPLRATDVELDYAAVMDSQDFLRLWSQSDWPTDDFTLADNLKDLERHEQEHLERKAFTFTVMNQTETECLGCVYINPLEPFPEGAIVHGAELATGQGYQAVAGFWVKPARIADGLDRLLLDTLIAWFEREWAFSQVCFWTNDEVTHQIELFGQSGLEQRLVIEEPDSKAKYVLFA
jgi:hypothetical protein